MTMKILTSILIFSAALYKVYTLCNSCSAVTQTACVANNQFSICVGGLPTSTSITTCPNGTVCTASQEVCSPAETSVPSCGMCGICNDNRTFACTSYNTFALCYGTTVPGSVSYSCSNSTVCVYDDPEMCVDPLISGIGGTCPVSTANNVTETTVSSSIGTTVSTTVSPAETTTTTPLNFCSNVTSVGRFELTTDIECKQYIFCALINNTWVGNIYECPGSTLFNSTTGLCGIEVPVRCA